jgi:hypothetical protein
MLFGADVPFPQVSLPVLPAKKASDAHGHRNEHFRYPMFHVLWFPCTFGEQRGFGRTWTLKRATLGARCSILAGFPTAVGRKADFARTWALKRTFSVPDVSVSLVSLRLWQEKGLCVHLDVEVLIFDAR